MSYARLSAIALAAMVCVASPAGAVTTMKVQETAANLAKTQELLGLGTPMLTFKSSLPGEKDFPDELDAFGETKKGEKAIIVAAGADLAKLTPRSEVAFYDDAAMKKLSDLVVLYQTDKLVPAAVGFVSFDGGGAPEPATWTMLLIGFMGAGAALRRVGGSRRLPA